MKKIPKYLTGHTEKIINYEKKEKIPLKNEENKSYSKQKVCHICKKEFSIDNEKNDKKVIEYKIIVITLVNIEALLVIFVI